MSLMTEEEQSAVGGADSSQRYRHALRLLYSILKRDVNFGYLSLSTPSARGQQQMFAVGYAFLTWRYTVGYQLASCCIDDVVREARGQYQLLFRGESGQGRYVLEYIRLDDSLTLTFVPKLMRAWIAALPSFPLSVRLLLRKLFHRSLESFNVSLESVLNAVGALFFLRVVGAFLIQPESIGVVRSVSIEQRKRLLVLSRGVQKLANLHQENTSSSDALDDLRPEICRFYQDLLMHSGSSDADQKELCSSDWEVSIQSLLGNDYAASTTMKSGEARLARGFLYSVHQYVLEEDFIPRLQSRLNEKDYAERSLTLQKLHIVSQGRYSKRDDERVTSLPSPPSSPSSERFATHTNDKNEENYTSGSNVVEMRPIIASLLGKKVVVISRLSKSKIGPLSQRSSSEDDSIIESILFEPRLHHLDRSAGASLNAQTAWTEVDGDSSIGSASDGLSLSSSTSSLLPPATTIQSTSPTSLSPLATTTIGGGGVVELIPLEWRWLPEESSYTSSLLPDAAEEEKEVRRLGSFSRRLRGSDPILVHPQLMHRPLIKMLQVTSQSRALSVSSDLSTTNGGGLVGGEVYQSVVKRLLSSAINTYRVNADFVAGKGKDFRARDEWIEFEAMCGELSRINLSTSLSSNALSHNQKLCFWLNLYHTLVLHAHAYFGFKSSAQRGLAFWQQAKYSVGSNVYNMIEIEHCILRACTSKPALEPVQKKSGMMGKVGSGLISSVASAAVGALVPKFKKNDPRAALALNRPAPLVSFVMNCGALGCAPITIFEEDTVMEEMERITAAVLMESVSFRGDGMGHITVVEIPQMLAWYYRDFSSDLCRSLVAACECVRRHLSPPFWNKIKEIKRMKDKHSLTFEVKKFDWSFGFAFAFDE